MTARLIVPLMAALIGLMAVGRPCWADVTAKKSSAKARVKPFRYVVKTGDTASGLAQRWGLREQMISPQHQQLRVGQVISIPLKDRRRVRRGESISGFSKTYGLPIETIAKFNNVPPPYEIRSGRTILIPDMAER